MSTKSQISVLNLSGKSSYEKNINVQRSTIKTTKDLKDVLSKEFKIGKESFDILKLSEARILSSEQVLPDSDIKEPLYLVIHPNSRDIPPHLKTDEEDMINGSMEDDERILMSCGHGIVPDTLYDYCWNMLKQGKNVFCCPAITSPNRYLFMKGKTCGAEWSLYEVTIKARLSDDERILFEMKMSDNKLKEDQTVQQCPFCSTISVRVNESNIRVRCLTCSNKKSDPCEFCWYCLHPWKTEGVKHCGNLECRSSQGPKAFQEILSSCPKKNVDGYRNVPSIRSCPKCKALIEHQRGCKRMPCKVCGVEFCFVCLQDWTNTGCGYGKTCPSVAGVQTYT